MKIWAEKLVAAFVISVVSLILGFLPLLLASRFDFSSIDSMQPLLMKKNKKNPKNVILSFLLNLGGGVLLANCFCHWLPEVREGLEEVNTTLPLAEIILVCGFFFISAVEEILHHFLHPHRTEAGKSIREGYESFGETDEVNLKEKERETTSAKVKTALRTVFTVFALSFHTIVEGFALGLSSDSGSIWMNAAATATHKFVISFSIGVELISNKVSVSNYTISTVIFSFSSAIGSLIATILAELSVDSVSLNLPLQIVQSVAAGVILYVVFFEVFPKAKMVGGTGTQHILAMVLGFAIFLPSLYLHGHEHEHGHEESTCPSNDILNYCLTQLKF